LPEFQIGRQATLPSSRRSSHRSIRIWRWPAALAILTVFGLMSALLGQGGIWWTLSWLALATPLAVTVTCVANRRR
jgi:hypothetical protein